MKRIHSRVLLSLIFGIAVTFAINAQTPKKFIGTWDQDAPDAPGYETAKVVIEELSITTTFTNGSVNTAELAKYESDTLWYNMDVDGEYVTCNLVFNDKNNLKGYASWSSGETDLILTKMKE